MGTNGEEWTNTASLRFLFSPELLIHSLTELSSLIDSITTTESVDHHHFLRTEQFDLVTLINFQVFVTASSSQATFCTHYKPSDICVNVRFGFLVAP